MNSELVETGLLAGVPGPDAAGQDAAEPLPDAPLPDRLAAALEAFRRHLAAERGLSGHTVRAYLGDVRALLDHAAQAGVTSPDGLDIAVLRGWLAGPHARGRGRAGPPPAGPGPRGPGGPRRPGRSPPSGTPAAGWLPTRGRSWVRPNCAAS